MCNCTCNETASGRRPWHEGLGGPAPGARSAPAGSRFAAPGLLLIGALTAGLAIPAARGQDPVPAAEPEPGVIPIRPPLVVAFNEFSGELPNDLPAGRFVQADSESQYAQRVSRNARRRPGFLGTLLVRAPGSVNLDWPPTASGQLHVRVTVHDVDALLDWEAQGLTPGFLTGGETTEIPTEAEAAFDLELLQRGPGAAELRVHLRFRASDGYCALVELEQNGGPQYSGGGGPWWPVCCGTQWLLCEVSRLVFPDCGDCYQACLLNCLQGGSNPCHSCGACGLSDFLCRFVPGAHC